MCGQRTPQGPGVFGPTASGRWPLTSTSLPSAAFSNSAKRHLTHYFLTLDLGPTFILGMGRMNEGLRIGELAKACDVSRDTLRFYERERLLPRAQRSPAGYRLYGEDDAARVRFVKRAQGMGLTLEDVRELLRVREIKTPEQCRRVAARLRTRIKAVDKKLAELAAFRKELASNLKDCERAASQAERCPVVLDLAGNAGKEEQRE